jgi:PelA/Pel-15E family pectate lyase
MIPLALFVFTAAGLGAAEPTAGLPASARASLARATDYLRSISAGGGYLWRYSADLKHRAGEEIATPTQIWVQPPGTPSVGQSFLRAYEVTKDARYLDAARAAADALARGQLESGGWDYVVDFDPAQRGRWKYRFEPGTPAAGTTPRNISTYDDDNTQSALRFLLAFADAAKSAPDPRDARIRDALDYGLRKLMEAQYPIGAWPQRWDGQPRDPAAWPVKPASYPADYPRTQPTGSYYTHYTLNDHTQRDAILTLIAAHKRTGRAEYLAAAKRGADFLVLAQMPEPQPIWAQQYNAAVNPAWARAFEPPGVTSNESAGAMRLLTDLYLEWGDERLVRGFPAAIAWYRRSEIAPGRWARLYELQTNKPIYGDRDGKIHYTPEELTEERRTGYSWQGEYGIPATLERALAVMGAGRTKWLADHAVKPPTAAERTARAQRLAPAARAAIEQLDAQGRWLSNVAGIKLPANSGPFIDTALFEQRVRALCDYLEAAAK